MKVSKYINPNIIQDGGIDGNKKIKDYPPLKKGSGDNSVCQDSCTATGRYSHAEGESTIASGVNSHAEGSVTKALGVQSHAEGGYTTAKGDYSHAEGMSTVASGNISHAEGLSTTASGRFSHAEGNDTTASGSCSHAEGLYTSAEGNESHTEGMSTVASGTSSHAEGFSNEALGYASHAEGYNTTAKGQYSHTEGYETTAYNDGEHAEGRYNISRQGKTIHAVGIGNSNTDRKNVEEIHLDGKHYIYGIGGYDGTNSQTEGIKTVQEVVAESANAVQIKYADLKSLRDLGKLVPGTQYRITDYTCTTTQSGTKSAGHVFDIIVTADDESTLNEVARAVKHDGDTYFDGCDLNAWKLWYCLDNDTSRFAWADATNGKGVIYRMIDEFNNDVPYDFKNIQFYRKWNYRSQLWSNISSDNTGVPCYTFSSHGDMSTTSFTDNSLSISNYVYSNVIKEYIGSKKQTLNNNCFFGDDCYSNTFGADCYDNSFRFECSCNSFGFNCNRNTFGYGCYNNSFGYGCYSNSFGYGCYNNSFRFECSCNSFGFNCNRNTFGNSCNYNTLEYKCSSNTFGNSCSFNTFGNSCSLNTFGNNCKDNSFGNSCESNSFGNSCNYNTFGNSCESNSFGNSCNYNTFGSNCWSNVLENYCCHNSFGDSCWSNSFGNSCNYNTFGKDCNYNSLGNECGEIKFASDSMGSTKYDFYQNNHFGDGCQYIIFKGIEGSSENPIPVNPGITNSGSPTPEPPVGLNQVRKYNFSQGIRGTSSDYLTIDGVRGRTYETKVSKNSSGELKIYCEADLIL